MKTTNINKYLEIILAAIIILALGLVACQQTAAMEFDNTPIEIENSFITCQLDSILEEWVEDGVKHIRGKFVNGEVKSTENYHVGPATNLSNSDIILETMSLSADGKIKMFPEAYPDGGWEGTFVAQGPVGFQTGTAVLEGTGSLEGYITKLWFMHKSGPALHEMFPDACGGNMPLGGTIAEGYILIPNGK